MVTSVARSTRAVVITGPRTAALVGVRVPDPGPGVALVEVNLCGVCGTDLHLWSSGAVAGTAGFGHEYVGRVTTAGKGASVAEGDRVVGGVPRACGRCGYCLSDLAEHCEAVLATLLRSRPPVSAHGAFASVLAADSDRLVPVDHRLTDVQAAQLEPMAVAVHAVGRAGVRPGDTVAVLGAGAIGSMVLQAARVAGAATVVAVDPSGMRRQSARALGATASVDSGEAATQAVADRTAGRGVDIVVDCTGEPGQLACATELARRGGRVCLVGAASTAHVAPALWVVRELTVVASLAYTRHDFTIAAGLIADGRVDLAATHGAPVGLEALADVLPEIAAARTRFPKTLVDPHEGVRP